MHSRGTISNPGSGTEASGGRTTAKQKEICSMGKKWIPTEETYAEIERMAALGLNEQDIAHNLNVYPTTLSDKKKDFQEIEEAITRGRAKGVVKVTGHLMEQIEGGNHQAAAFYLKNRRPQEWNDIQSVAAIQVNLGKLTDTQLLDELRADQSITHALANELPELEGINNVSTPSDA